MADDVDRLYRAVRKNRRNRIRKAGYFGAGKRRRRRRFVRAMYQEHPEMRPRWTGTEWRIELPELARNLNRFLYGWW